MTKCYFQSLRQMRGESSIFQRVDLPSICFNKKKEREKEEHDVAIAYVYTAIIVIELFNASFRIIWNRSCAWAGIRCTISGIAMHALFLAVYSLSISCSKSSEWANL